MSISELRKPGPEAPQAQVPKDGSQRYTEAISEFERLGREPHGGDRKMGAFYQAAYEIASSDNSFGAFLRNATQRDIQTSHFANLLLRGIQYIEIFKKGRTEYGEEFLKPEAWKELLVGENGVIPTHEDELKSILNNRETTTTKYQRYAGIKAALNAVFPDQRLKIADFGCGANYGIPGFQANISFPDDISAAMGTDLAFVTTITPLLNAPIQIDSGLSVDKNNPRGEEEGRWRLACNFYPGELTREAIEKFQDFETRIDSQPTNGLRFLQGDILELETNHANGTLPEHHFDAISMSTVLYQMTPDQQRTMIDTARRSLTDGGVIIIQDFALKDPTSSTGLKCKGISSEPYGYRTFVADKDPDSPLLEFLQFNNGRCREIKPGEDFDTVLSLAD